MEVSMTTLMTPENPRWPEFADRLIDALYIDDEHWRCDGDHIMAEPGFVHRHARLASGNGNIDIEGSLAFFREHGGHCDCEFNIDAPVRQKCASGR
jgi:hypothetical protein